jgi:glycerophosphoryl diester phosphodiesterase
MRTWHNRGEGGCLCIGHRGAGGLEPQNTLRAFQRAIDLSVDAVEFDIRWTADRQLVIAHSEDLAETTNGAGRVGDHTLAEIRLLDAGQGERIPTLDETLDLCKGKVLLVVDMKEAGYEQQVLNVVRDHDVLDDVLMCGLMPETLRQVRSLAPGLMTAISYPDDTGNASTKPYLAGAVRVALAIMRRTLPWRIGGMMRQVGANATMLYHKVITPAVVQAVHRQGGFIGAWTVDDPPIIERMRQCGVDSITSNRPDLVLQHIAAANPPRL